MLLGLCVDCRPPASTTPAEIAATGAQLARVVLKHDHDLLPFVYGCGELGVAVLPVITSESIAGWDPDWDDQEYAAWAIHLAEDYPARVWYAIEVGNEPDLDSPSSWTLDPEILNRLLRAVRGAFPSTPIVSGGLASGDPEWARSIEPGLYDFLGIHPYGRRPRELRLPAEYAEIEELMAGYAELGKPLVISEFGAPIRDFDDAADRAIYYAALAEYFAQNGVAAACAFCLAGVEEFALGELAVNALRNTAARGHIPGGVTMDLTQIHTSPGFPYGRPWAPGAGQPTTDGSHILTQPNGDQVAWFEYGKVEAPMGREPWGFPTGNHPALSALINASPLPSPF